MLHLISHAIGIALAHYGYLIPPLFVMIESLGIPFPGETAVIASSVYARASHGHLNIFVVWMLATAGAIVGDNIGYWIGRTGGYRVAHRHGKLLHLNERRLTYGVYLFRHHGEPIVFFGRWLALLRMWAALLAGINTMAWKRFFVYNALGGVSWCACFCALGYFLGDDVHLIETWVAGGLWLIFGGIVLGFIVYFRKNEDRLEDEAEGQLPLRVKHRIAVER